METVKFKTNINCSGCVMKVEPLLNAEASIHSWEIDTKDPNKVLSVEIEKKDAEQVIKAVHKAGYSIELL